MFCSDGAGLHWGGPGRQVQPELFHWKGKGTRGRGLGGGGGTRVHPAPVPRSRGQRSLRPGAVRVQAAWLGPGVAPLCPGYLGGGVSGSGGQGQRFFLLLLTVYWTPWGVSGLWSPAVSSTLVACPHTHFRLPRGEPCLLHKAISGVPGGLLPSPQPARTTRSPAWVPCQAGPCPGFSLTPPEPLPGWRAVEGSLAPPVLPPPTDTGHRARVAQPACWAPCWGCHAQ